MLNWAGPTFWLGKIKGQKPRTRLGKNLRDKGPESANRFVGLAIQTASSPGLYPVQ